MYKKFILSIFIILTMITGNSAYGYDAEKIIRVGISDNSFQKYFYEESEFYSDGQIEITDISTGKNIKTNGHGLKVEMSDGNFNVYEEDKLKISNAKGPLAVKSESLIGIANLKRAGKPAFYKGIIELVRSEREYNKFAIVNVLDLKNYLKGVVPNEMPVSFGSEALKAQCIAARNYALRPREKYYNEYDICDSVACQVYFGAKTECELSNKAVEETDGLVALYENNLILALYSSTSGGYTESYANAFSEPMTRDFPGKDIPYLRAKSDIPDLPSLDTEEAAREFYTTVPETYDNDSSYFRWEKSWEIPEFVEMLNKTMFEQRAFVYPKFTEEDTFTTLKEIKIKQRGNSGKVMFIEIETEKGLYTIGKELTIRRLFKKNGKALPSANFVCDIINKDGVPYIKFSGGGFGHGVGMSQYGAGKMSKTGFSFDKILKHYYTGINIGTIPQKAEAKQGKNSVTHSLYIPEGKALLHITDAKNVTNFTAIINGKETHLDSRLILKKESTDISDYLRDGFNTIEIILPVDEYLERELTTYIEIQGAEK